MAQTGEISTQNQFNQASCGYSKQIGGFTALCGSTLQAQIASGQVAVPGSAQSKLFFTKASAQKGIFFTASPQDGGSTPPPATTPAPTPTGSQLVLSFPTGLLGEEYLFGGVITKVTDKTNTNLGDLKLTDLPPINVRPMISGSDTSSPQLVLVGCASNCTETSEQDALAAFPIVGTDATTNSVLVDLAAVAKDLDLITMLDPDGSTTGLKTTATRTLSFDYSLSTLVFDVASDMVPVTPAPTPTTLSATADSTGPTPPPSASGAPAVTTFTTRWYLRLASAFSSSFEPRPATPGVGFFMTERSANPVIERQSLEQLDGPAIHYYIKNVPAEFQPAFQAALDEWNTKLTALVGRALLSYEFVPAGDPLNDQLVPGDIRYHIIEWDVTNDASYGGLGPSIANQFTGQILTSNILIQGPTIVGLYTDWFKVKDTAAQLASAGRSSEAENLVKDFTMTYQARQAKFAKIVRLNLNSKLAMRVVGQLPSLHDPIGDFSATNPAADRNDFLDVPVDVSYATYMAGYFQDMVEHEMGHNLGLRHNFRGNLGATDQNGTVAPQLGQVSRSVMEYLNRSYRYLDRIDSYDLMALGYGYNGEAPTVTNAFCTDEDQPSATAPTASAECTENDATSDPFSWWQAQLSRVIDKLTARQDTSSAPTWALTDMSTEVGQVLVGLGSYSSSAAATASGWTNFFGKTGRPASAADVPAYVKAAVKSQLCDPALVTATAAKPAAAQAAVLKNLTDLRAAAATQLAPFGFTAADLSCN